MTTLEQGLKRWSWSRKGKALNKSWSHLSITCLLPLFSALLMQRKASAREFIRTMVAVGSFYLKVMIMISFEEGNTSIQRHTLLNWCAYMLITQFCMKHFPYHPFPASECERRNSSHKKRVKSTVDDEKKRWQAMVIRGNHNLLRYSLVVQFTESALETLQQYYKLPHGSHTRTIMPSQKSLYDLYGKDK